MTFFVYFDLIIKNNIASFLVVLIIGKVVYFNNQNTTYLTQLFLAAKTQLYKS